MGKASKRETWKGFEGSCVETERRCCNWNRVEKEKHGWKLLERSRVGKGTEKQGLELNRKGIESWREGAALI